MVENTPVDPYTHEYSLNITLFLAGRRPTLPSLGLVVLSVRGSVPGGVRDPCPDDGTLQIP